MKYQFVRYGSLNRKKQKGFKESDTFHSPPQSKGFYAFPKGFEEIFLVSELSYQDKLGLPTVTKTEVWRYWDNVKGEFVIQEYKDEYKDIWKVKRRFEVKADDLIWHHLESCVQNKKDILAVSKDWCCTTVKVWRKAFNKCINSQRTKSKIEYGDKGSSIKEFKRDGVYSRDHLEVFFNIKIK